MQRTAFPYILILFSSAVASAQSITEHTLAVYSQNGDIALISMSCLQRIEYQRSDAGSQFLVAILSEGRHQRFEVNQVDSITIIPMPPDDGAADMGLSVRWAARNVGAAHPEDYGNYYAWGETNVKSEYTEENYAFYQDYDYLIPQPNICATTYDIAHVSWAHTWRMPTRSEVNELYTSCIWYPATLNGIQGYWVVAPNGGSIFLPSAGYRTADQLKETGSGGFYWTGSINRALTSTAYNLNFRQYTADWSANRAYGFTIRPVCSP